MASGHQGAVLREIHRLFSTGTVTGLTEGQLLERFVSRRDEAAFEALVARHGPMVLAVCRQVLRDEHEVEDAFQAAFLVLVRKASSLRQRDLVGNWLHGVAYRVAVRARTDTRRRRGRERLEPDGLFAKTEQVWGFDSDLTLDLHGELGRLPEKLRSPIVLCYLEGLTHDEAARRLRWPVGTVRSRLARARDLLRARLSRQGLAPTAGLLAVVLNTQSTTAAVPPALLDSTVKAAMQYATGQAARAGAVSASVVVLTEGVLRTMTVTKLKAAAILLTAFSAVAAGAGVFAYQDAGSAAPAPTAPMAPAQPAPATIDTAPPAPPSTPAPPTAPLAPTPSVSSPPTTYVIPAPATASPLPPTAPNTTPQPAPHPDSAPRPSASAAILTTPPPPAPPTAPLQPTAANAPPVPPPAAEPSLSDVLTPASVWADTQNLTVPEYLEKTRKEVDAAINRLSQEVTTLSDRLEKAQANLSRLQALKAVLDQNTEADLRGRVIGTAVRSMMGNGSEQNQSPISPSSKDQQGRRSQPPQQNSLGQGRTNVSPPAQAAPRRDARRTAPANELVPLPAVPGSVDDLPLPKANETSPEQKIRRIEAEIDRLIKELNRAKEDQPSPSDRAVPF